MGHAGDGGQASDQASKVGQAGAGHPNDTSLRRHANGGHMWQESIRITDTEPGSALTHQRQTTHSQMWHC
jgi:hypothetical protein